MQQEQNVCKFNDKITNYSILGYKKIVVSSKPTAASFSFGQRHKHTSRFHTDGPGPSAYDITGLSIKGIQFEKKRVIRIQVTTCNSQVWRIFVICDKIFSISAYAHN